LKENLWAKIENWSLRLFFWEGNPSMEIRIFNATLVIVFFFSFFLAFVNVFIGNYTLVAICLFAAICVVGFLYLLRVKNAYKITFYLSSLITYPILAYNFINNDGVSGPSFYVFLLLHLIILSIVRIRFYLFWTLSNSVFFLILFYIGLYHADLIPQNYGSKEMVITDHFITYLASLIGMTILVASLKRFYAIQKNKVVEKTNELVRINNSLKKASSQKDRIFTIISHDLKNPLQSIIQTLELVNSGELTEEEVKFLNEELLKTTNRTFQMMENILDWSSFELKNVATKTKKILIKDLLEDTAEIFKVIAKQKKIALQINYQKNPMINIETDRLLLIFRNLVQNAIKFTPTEGLVTIDVNAEEDLLILTISDNGIGISSDRLKNIFDQEIKSTYGTEQEKGTGMGLHLCFQSAHQLGGALDVESKEGVGSTFKLTIPTGLPN
jgi:signal transduction histidine kinase